MITAPRVCFLALLTGTASLAASADNRFDGTWIGTETVGPKFAFASPPQGGAGSGTANMMQSSLLKRPAKIVVAGGGTLVGVVDGHCPGRYNNVRRVGNTLTVEAGDCKLEFSISSDGRSLQEKGSATGSMATGTGNVRYGKTVPFRIEGSFHR